MVTVPAVLFARYQAHLKAENLSVDKSFEYQNWLRYFLDFCEKYRVAGSPSERLHQFIAKLRDKGRTEEKRQQAAHAIALYFEMLEGVTDQVRLKAEDRRGKHARSY